MTIKQHIDALSEPEREAFARELIRRGYGLPETQRLEALRKEVVAHHLAFFERTVGPKGFFKSFCNGAAMPYFVKKVFVQHGLIEGDALTATGVAVAEHLGYLNPDEAYPFEAGSQEAT